MKHSDFFLQHLREEVKDRYDLTDQDLDRVLELSAEFGIKDLKKALLEVQRKATPTLLKRILEPQPDVRQELLPRDSLVLPIGLPAGEMRIAGPIYSIPISEKEQALAEQLRHYFERFVEGLEGFLELLKVFFENTDSLDDKTSVVSLAPLIRKYQHKLKRKFNDLIRLLASVLEFYHSGITDTKFDSIRDLIIENTKSMREGLLDLVKLFKRIEDSDFMKNAKTSYTSIKSDIEQMLLIIKKELFSHIDRDYLGKIRLSSRVLPLSLMELISANC